LPPLVASALAWVGVTAVAVATFTFSAGTAYPGWAAALPVGGAALIIGGGVAADRTGPESVLGTVAFRWIGKWSFSIYLWHWPILTIAKEDSTHGLDEAHRLLLVGLSVVAAALTYAVIENPIRHSRWLARSSVRSLALGLAIVAVLLAVCTFEIHSHSNF
jgi:peptidoglycan/LPS O-acetylase OafA/YrhL